VQQDRATMKGLAEQDKTNSDWQRDLIVSLTSAQLDNELHAKFIPETAKN
jgi:hypothetical protein